MRSFLNIKNINTISLLLLILVIIYLINTDFTGNEHRFDVLSTAYQKTVIQQKYNHPNENKFEESNDISDSENLCSSFRQVKAEEINCLTGELITRNFEEFGYGKYKSYFTSIFSNQDEKTHPGEPYDIVWDQVYQKKKEKLEFLISLKNNLVENADQNEHYHFLILILTNRTNSLVEKFQKIREDLLDDPKERKNQYKKLFLVSLELDGNIYSQVTGEFKKVSWGVGTILEQGDNFAATHERITVFKKYLSLVAIFPLMFIVYFFIEYKSKTMLIYFVSLCSSICISLYIGLDASINFGLTSSKFIISPFVDIFERQIVISMVGYSLLFISVFYFDYFRSLIGRMHLHQEKLVFFGIVFVVAGYSSFSAAMGSEIMKVFVILFSSFMTCRYSREIFLIQKYCNYAFNKINFKKILFKEKDSNKKIIVSEYLNSYVIRGFLYFVLMTSTFIFLSLFIFNDIGGVFITLVLVMILVSIVFGLRFFFFWIVIMVILGLIGSFTEKINQRIELMLEPMNASVSDFARLINFTNSESDDILVGNSWCNDHGVCLPLQVLSDYMPLLIEKVFGFGGALFLLTVLTALFCFVATKSFYIFLTGEKENRLPSILIFYMSCSSIIQIILSTFGNWRLIPLSGISLPFMSIGFTAMILPCLTFGLFVGMNMKIKKVGYSK
ncbi:FtsW/RodA/SpoVE family cell cycle protein [Betaproteobacteria bacterium]|nr:FtsW/RodA/SpoVE family cell cycle protein [Betaproteobacteria bacterium]